MKRFPLRKMLVASGLTLLPMVIGFVLWDRLPDVMTTHWGATGEADGTSSKWFAVCGLPLIMLALLWLSPFLNDLDSRNRDGRNKKAKELVIWLLPLMSCVISSVIYAASLGIVVDISVSLGLVFGVLFVGIGNYLPKCKQNYTIGIRVKPALESEENWNATHRLAGKVWFFGGFSMFALMFLPDALALGVMMGITAVMVIVPTVYSYAYRRRQLRAEQNDIQSLKVSKSSKIISMVVLAHLVLILGGCAVLMFTGSVDVMLGDTDFEVHTVYWTDITVSYDEIDSIEYRENFTGSQRLSGFESAVLSLGIYKSDDLGIHTRYTVHASDAAIVLRGEDRVLVISGKTDAETAALYESLKEAIM